jgi:succinoglycan biosynthesis protein ExoA
MSQVIQETTVKSLPQRKKSHNPHKQVRESIYLTVVLPVYNEEKFIGATLEALVKQDYPVDRYELIVVDGHSSDGTRRVVEAFISEHSDVSVRLLENPGRLSSCGRNIGARAARGRLIAVIDGHVHIPNNRLFATMERLKKKRGALCLARPAPLLVPGIEDGMPFWIALARKSWLAHSRQSYIYRDHEGFVDPVSSGFAYDRSVFDRVGYFDETFDAAEDAEFHQRLKQAGIQAYSSPALTINSYPRSTLAGLFRQMTRYGIGRARLIRKHPDGFTKETLIPAAVFLFFAALPVAACCSMQSAVLGLVYAAFFLLYWLLALSAGVAATWQKHRLFSGVLVALAIFVTHFGLGWGFVKTFFQQRVGSGELCSPDSAIQGAAPLAPDGLLDPPCESAQ